MLALGMAMKGLSHGVYELLVKGAIVGLQWAQYMHGFDRHAAPAAFD